MSLDNPPDAAQSQIYLGRRLSWAQRKLAKLAPDYRFKWDAYFDRLEELAKHSGSFLDAGCGDNRTAAELEGPRLRLGLDQNRPNKPYGTYVAGRLERIPFRSEAFDLVGCRYVAEHLEDPAAVFAELRRVMKPGGRLLIQTVNHKSLLIRLSRLLGGRIRRFVSVRRYGRKPEDVSRVFDRFNTPDLFEDPPDGFRLIKLSMIQDVDVQSRLGFWLTYILLRWTRNRPHARSTITAEWERI
jgi:SAM-dependent methyltransferase